MTGWTVVLILTALAALIILGIAGLWNMRHTLDRENEIDDFLEQVQALRELEGR